MSDHRHLSAADLEACNRLLRNGSRSFFIASLLLPGWLRESACALYAFCRVADDVVDLDGGSPDAIASLHERLSLVYAGRPLPYPEDRALAVIVTNFGIPKALLTALIEGFEWDANGRKYEDLSALCGYAARVAGTVGAMMAMLMGVREPEVAARACDLGVAMQLTNIARDVGEDARNGRLYLPQQWLREEGIDPQVWLANPQFTPRIGSVIRRLLQTADVFYARALAGIDRLPVSCRPGIHAARLIYAEIGREVERRGCDAVSSRATVSARRKLRLLAAALRQSIRSVPRESVSPCEETRFLVDALEAVASLPKRGTARLSRPEFGSTLNDRVNWLIDLFERLERQDVGRQQALAMSEGLRNVG